ncbi:hypothetical protein Aperf_G00000054433 [Anoplocephala perfoliata]
MLEQYSGKDEEVRHKIKEELDENDDIILADYEDTYYNLTWKTVTNPRWISAFCNKLDIDVFMIIDENHREQRRTSIFGRIAEYDIAHRSPEANSLSYKEMEWNKMCAYPRGFAQLIGAEFVDDMAIASAYTRYNYMHEDVHLNLLALKLQIPLINVDGMFDHNEYVLWRRSNQLTVVALHHFMELKYGYPLE